ncbi:hypothetical protein [Streptomyces sp. 111WW2]|uniref:hypothetical protein n=1 Tax=Streptomyces sp. 111WW2 TaxID=1945515 RepID=UPI0010575373|nr:hypothetical protein [Streptomyces sp. 111WW2]
MRSRGEWFRAGAYSTAGSARTMAYNVGAATFKSYRPAGSFEAYAETCSEGHTLWVRYVAGDGPVPELRDTLTLRVRHDGEQFGYEDVAVMMVNVRARCPVCGGPRGTTIAPYSFEHGGEQLTADAWHNPCGHTDAYDEVIAESLRRDSTSPATLVLRAVAERRLGQHAAAVILVLEQHGHADAAALVRAEIKNRNGHLTAKQAALYLQSLAGGDPR